MVNNFSLAGFVGFMYHAVSKKRDCIIIGLMVINSIMPTLVNHIATCLVLPMVLLTVMLTRHCLLVQQHYLTLLSQHIISCSIQYILQNIAFSLIDSLLTRFWFWVPVSVLLRKF